MKKYNLIVAGGGITGIAAAVSAAREGLSVLLVEKEGCLGGAISNNLVFPFMNYFTTMPETNQKKLLSGGIFTEMQSHHAKYFKSHNKFSTYFSPEHYKLTFDEMITEAGVDVLFHGMIFDVTTKEKNIHSVKIATRSDVLEISADFFIDATGDGQLFYLSGCDYQLGRESDNYCQPMTTCFRICNVDEEKFNKDLPDLQKKYKEEKMNGKIKNPREDILVFRNIAKGVLHFNTTRIVKLDPTNPFDISQAEITAREQIAEMENFLKANSTAFDNSEIINIAAEIGVRESRKLKGVHILTAEDLKNCTKFLDRIALGNYDIDIHNPTGSGTSHYFFSEGKYYSIPYRSLLPKEFNNLLVAGRCISATHEAQASVRIMPICATMGQAAGTAAALAFNTAENVHTVDITELQNMLRKNGAVID